MKISLRVTKHERHLTLGNEQGVVEGEVSGMLGWLGDGHWGGHLMGWTLGVMLCVGKLNSNKKNEWCVPLYGFLYVMLNCSQERLN